VKIDNFFAELKRRNVYKVAVAYVVAGWALSQGIAQVFPVFDIPNWVIRLIVLLIIIGLPIALVLAWMFELTPQGIKRTETADAMPEPGRQKKHTWIYVVVIGGLLSIGLFFLGRYTARNSSSASSSELPSKSIAVLPFENLSEDKANEYFASGMHDMILTKLAAIGDLKVISRTSTEKYASHPGDLKTIARQLGVATILEGSVQKSGNSMLINVQLIDAASDNHLWAEAYPRTLDNIFGVEGEVAQKVADALKAKLTPTESASVASVPTHNPEAYDLYLRANANLRRGAETSALVPKVIPLAIEHRPHRVELHPELVVLAIQAVQPRHRDLLFPLARDLYQLVAAHGVSSPSDVDRTGASPVLRSLPTRAHR